MFKTIFGQSPASSGALETGDEGTEKRVYSARPLFTIRPRSGMSLTSVKELWNFRDLLTSLALRDLKLRYKQTALGVIWVVLQPLMAAGIFSFVFGTVARMPSDGLPYFLFSYAGLLGWGLFNGTVTKAGASLTGNAQLISKVYFPRLLLPLSSVPSVLVDFAVAAIMMAVAMVIYAVAPPLTLFLLPVWSALLLLLAIGLGLLVTSLSVSYRDVQYIVPVFLQILLFASPIPYSVTDVPAHLRVVYYLNPLTVPLEGFRASLLGTRMPDGGAVAYSAIVAVILFLVGVYSFQRMERRFADVI